MSTLAAIKHNHQARENEEQNDLKRRRAILLLIHQHLIEHGYAETASIFSREAGFDINRYTVADNIDFETIMMDYEHFYQTRFHGKAPKLYRKLRAKEKKNVDPLYAPPSTKSDIASQRSKTSHGAESNKKERLKGKEFMIQQELDKRKQLREQKAARNAKIKKRTGSQPKSKPAKKPVPKEEPKLDHQDDGGFQSTGLNLMGNRIGNMATQAKPRVQDNSDDDSDTDDENHFKARILKPIPIDFYGERRQLAEIVTRDIINDDPNVHWDDIAGLSQAKQLVTEAVVMPLKFPQFFTGLLQPWKGILLYGPPGTGKTMLAKAVATECKTTFFNISASTIVSKWRGESEKLIRVLFELARYHAPSTIFLDEFDAIMGQRGAREHEGSRRMKTELLIQMDGLRKTKDHVFVLAASNLPWDLDAAILRRLEKRIIVDLPNQEAREAIFQRLLPNTLADELDYNFLAHRTSDYSGSDINLVCKEAAMRPLRKVMQKLSNVLHTSQNFDEDMKDQLPEVAKVKMRDIGLALKVTKPSGNMYKAQYKEFSETRGSQTTAIDSDDEEDE